MSEQLYTIEQIAERPIFLITWGGSRQFSPNDDAFISDVNKILNEFDQPVTLIIDATQFAFTVGKAMENIILASGRADTIPNHPHVKAIVFVSNNRFVHLMVSRITQRHASVAFKLVKTIEEARHFLEI